MLAGRRVGRGNFRVSRIILKIGGVTICRRAGMCRPSTSSGQGGLGGPREQVRGYADVRQTMISAIIARPTRAARWGWTTARYPWSIF